MRLEKDLTPHSLKCGIGTCPAVYAASNDKLVIIGKRLDDGLLKDLSDKIAKDEYAIMISRELLANVIRKRKRAGQAKR